MPNKEMTVQEPRTPTIWDPLKEIRALGGISDIFEDLFSGIPMLRFPAPTRAWMPRVDIHETDKEYVITAALPGVRKEDVKVTVENGVLILSGERKSEKEEKDKNYVRRETMYGSFQRSFVLPAGVHPEDVKAHQKDGLLTVAVYKPAPSKSRGINVKVE